MAGAFLIPLLPGRGFPRLLGEPGGVPLEAAGDVYVVAWAGGHEAVGMAAEADIKYTIPAPDVCAAYALKLLDNMCVQSEYVYCRKGKNTKMEENTMTRFEREINGSLGIFWKKNAEEEVRKAVAQADTQATVDTDGAIRWNSNGRYLMDDFCEKLE